MATLSEKVVTALLATTAVTDAVTTRVYRMRAPQDVKQPYIVVWMPTHLRLGHLRGMTDLENPLVRFDLFGVNFMQLEALRETIIDMMSQTFGAVYRFGAELYEDDTRLYHLMADFSVWHTKGS